MTDTTAIARPAPADPLATILSDPQRLAEIDADKLDRLYEIAAKARAEAARVEFAAAMNRVQSRMTPVYKAARNSNTHSMYARAEDVEAMLMPLLVDAGFSVGFSTEPQTDAMLRVVMVLRHVGGHEERHTLPAPVDNVGMKGTPTKTALHGMGSTLTYCKRYLLCMVFSVTLTADDDGNAGGEVGPGSAPITAAECAELAAAADRAGVDWDKFYSHFGIAALSDLPAGKLALARSLIAEKQRFADRNAGRSYLSE